MESKGELSKNIILEKALGLFMREGFSGATFNEICEVTGFTKGGLYYHFPGGKNELYKEAIDYFFVNAKTPQWILEEDVDIEKRIKNGFLEIDRSKEWIMEKVGVSSDEAVLLFYSFLYEATRKYPEYQTAMDLLDREKHSHLETAFRNAQLNCSIRKDLDPAGLALELDALLQQLIYLNFVNGKIKTDKSVIENIMNNYLLRLK